MDEQERARFPEYAKYYDKSQFGDNQTIGDFIEWLGQNGFFIVRYEEVEGYYEQQPVHQGMNTEEWLCKYHGIDYRQAMAEKDTYLNELLDQIRSKH